MRGYSVPGIPCLVVTLSAVRTVTFGGRRNVGCGCIDAIEPSSNRRQFDVLFSSSRNSCRISRGGGGSWSCRDKELTILVQATSPGHRGRPAWAGHDDRMTPFAGSVPTRGRRLSCPRAKWLRAACISMQRMTAWFASGFVTKHRAGDRSAAGSFRSRRSRWGPTRFRHDCRPLPVRKHARRRTRKREHRPACLVPY